MERLRDGRTGVGLRLRVGAAAGRSARDSRQRQQASAIIWLIAPHEGQMTSCMAIQEVSAEPGAELRSRDGYESLR